MADSEEIAGCAEKAAIVESHWSGCRVEYQGGPLYAS